MLICTGMSWWWNPVSFTESSTGWLHQNSRAEWKKFVGRFAAMKKKGVKQCSAPCLFRPQIHQFAQVKTTCRSSHGSWGTVLSTTGNNGCEMTFNDTFTRCSHGAYLTPSHICQQWNPLTSEGTTKKRPSGRKQISRRCQGNTPHFHRRNKLRHKSIIAEGNVK
jgi:hypothetical protein